MIAFACPHCNARMKARDHLAGSSIRCQRCSQPLTVPTLAPPVRGEAVMEPASEPEAPAEVPVPEAPPIRRPDMANDYQAANGEPAQEEYPGETAQEDYLPEETQAPNDTDSSAYATPAGRPFGLLSSLLGIPGAALLIAGAFYPLFVMNGTPIQFEGWRLLMVQSGAILLGLVSLLLVLWRRYGGLWIMGPGALVALGVTFAVLLIRLKEERGWGAASTLRPGLGLLLLASGAAVLTLAVILSPKRRRYEYPG